MNARFQFDILLSGLAVSALASLAGGQVLRHQKISRDDGGLTYTLQDGSLFGSAITSLEDFDEDGSPDILVGIPGHDGNENDEGAVLRIALNLDGTVIFEHEISEGVGGFSGPLAKDDQFGYSTAFLGDIDNDGSGDVAVAIGAPGDDDGGAGRGAVWILFLDSTGTVTGQQKISSTQGGFAGVLDDNDGFGWSVAALGDLDGDNVVDLAVGAPFDDDGDDDQGAVWILFLNGTGTVQSHQKINQVAGTNGNDEFGRALATPGDLDGDGLPDLFVGAPRALSGGTISGVAFVLFLKSDGSLLSQSKIGAGAGGFAGSLDDADRFGQAVASPGDMDGDGLPDLAVGARWDDDGGADTDADRGAVYLLTLDTLGQVRCTKKVSSTQGGFNGTLDDEDEFGWALGAPGDLDGDGLVDVMVGARLDDDGASNTGAVWTLFLDNPGRAFATSRNDVGNTNPGGYEAEPPVIGQTWTHTIDNTGLNNTIAGFAGFFSTLEFPTRWGVLLVNVFDPGGELFGTPSNGGAGEVTIIGLVPNDVTLCGIRFSTQAVSTGGSGGVNLRNAYDFIIGTSL